MTELLDSPSPVDRQDVIKAVLKLLEDCPWSDLTFITIAQYLDIRPACLYLTFQTKTDILAASLGYIDESTVSQYHAHNLALSSSRDILFELIMCRLDVLENHKKSLKPLLKTILYGSPLTFLEMSPRALISLSFLLNTAHISTTSILGVIKLKAFAIVYGIIIKTWIETEDSDLSQTMVMVDKLLKKLEPLFVA